MKVKFLKGRTPELLMEALDKEGEVEILNIGPVGNRYFCFYIDASLKNNKFKGK